MSNKNLIAAHEAAANQERRYLRSLVLGAKASLGCARTYGLGAENEPIPNLSWEDMQAAQLDLVRAMDNIVMLFNRLTDKIVEYEMMLDRSDK